MEEREGECISSIRQLLLGLNGDGEKREMHIFACGGGGGDVEGEGKFVSFIMCCSLGGGWREKNA